MSRNRNPRFPGHGIDALNSRGRSPVIPDAVGRLTALLVAVLLAACSTGSGRPFQADMRFAPEAEPLPVVLTDETGLVTGIDGGPFNMNIDGGPFNMNADYGQPAIQPDPTDPSAFFVTWGSGPVQDAALSFEPFQDGYLVRLELHTRSGFPGGSTGELRPGIVRIVTSRPIPLDSIVAGGSANS